MQRFVGDRLSAELPGRWTVAYLLLAAAFVLSSAYVVAVGGWTTIVFDQWRIYEGYFTTPFPDNILAGQNGHHPVLPGLLFLVDIHWLGAHNHLLNALGILAAVLVAGVWSWVILVDNELPDGLRWLCVGLVWILTFWLGNARVLGHGNESLHVYPSLLGFFLAVGILLRHRPAQSRSPAAAPPPWPVTLGLVTFGCLVATFSYGLGLVTWPLVVLVAWLVGYRKTTLTALAGVGIGVVGLYFGLPAQGGGAPFAGIQPVAWVTDAAIWLGAPAFHALAPGDLWSVEVRLEVFSFGLGVVGLAVALWSLVAAVHRRSQATPLEIWTLAILGLGVAGALAVAVARGPYFDVLPQQRVAPRYLPWACIFWAAALIRLGLDAWRLLGARRAAVAGWVTLVILLSLALVPSHRGNDLEFAKHKMAQAGVGVALGLRDPSVTKILYRRPEVIDRLAVELDRRDLAMFAGPVEEEHGTDLVHHYRIVSSELGGSSKSVRVAPGDGEVLRFWGSITGATGKYDEVVVADDFGRIVGRGTIRGRGHRWARNLNLLADIEPQYGGFLVDYQPLYHYTVYAVDIDDRTAAPFATVARPAG